MWPNMCHIVTRTFLMPQMSQGMLQHFDLYAIQVRHYAVFDQGYMLKYSFTWHFIERKYPDWCYHQCHSVCPGLCPPNFLYP